jgi:hypothetical protein
MIDAFDNISIFCDLGPWALDLKLFGLLFQASLAFLASGKSLERLGDL